MGDQAELNGLAFNILYHFSILKHNIGSVLQVRICCLAILSSSKLQLDSYGRCISVQFNLLHISLTLRSLDYRIHRFRMVYAARLHNTLDRGKVKLRKYKLLVNK